LKWTVVGNRLVEQGIVVVCAAGNWGLSAGPFFHSGGASGDNVISVASVDAVERAVPAFSATFKLKNASNKTNIAYYNGDSTPFPRNLTHIPVIPLSGNLSAVNEACDPLPNGTRNLTGIVVLARRGGCQEYQKQGNLAAFGAQYVLFYNDEEPVGAPFFNDETIAGIIEAKAGKDIIGTINNGGQVVANFNMDPLTNYVGFFDSGGGKASDFTSWGSPYELQLKPDIAAPGGNIFSTALGGGYEVLSGTSQATPYVAGVAALWIGKYGGKRVNGPSFAKQLAAKIIHSGQAIQGTRYNGDSYGFNAPVMQVGNGLVDAIKVLNYTTSLSFAKFALNDTAHFNPTHSVDITNNAKKPVSYTFGLVPAAGFELWIPADPNISDSPRLKWQSSELSPQSIIPSVKFPSGTFTVRPGETRTAT
jgi:hypothetical protein